MVRDAAEIRTILGEKYPGIRFLENEAITQERYQQKDIILFDLSTDTDKQQVIKYFSVQKLGEQARETERKNILREYQVVKSLGDHPNIVKFYEANELLVEDELLGIFFVMEKFPLTLDVFINDNGLFSDEEIMDFLKQMDAVISMIHYEIPEPVVHSDIKPSNIGIRFKQNGRREYVLMDFDIVVPLTKNYSDELGFTLINKGAMRGFSPAYASPEQVLVFVHKSGTITNRVDIYSAGAIALQLITGIKPAPTTSELFYKLPINTLPKNWIPVFSKLCAADPKKRASRIRDALELFGKEPQQHHEPAKEIKIKITQKRSKESNRSVSDITIPLKDMYNYEMVLIEKGSFIMGNENGNPDEKPEHLVSLRAFYIGKYLVTQQLWTIVMEEVPACFEGEWNMPVCGVSWNEVQEFIERLNRITGLSYRLPSEAEWEYAARGGPKQQPFRFSGSDEINSVAWFKGNSGDMAHPGGMKKPNTSGIFDMSGNVAEWCKDWYKSDDYTKEPKRYPVGPKEGQQKVIRGGSFSDTESMCTNTSRYGHSPELNLKNVGFRLARPVALKIKIT